MQNNTQRATKTECIPWQTTGLATPHVNIHECVTKESRISLNNEKRLRLELLCTSSRLNIHINWIFTRLSLDLSPCTHGVNKNTKFGRGIMNRRLNDWSVLHKTLSLRKESSYWFTSLLFSNNEPRAHTDSITPFSKVFDILLKINYLQEPCIGKSSVFVQKRRLSNNVTSRITVA